MCDLWLAIIFTFSSSSTMFTRAFITNTVTKINAFKNKGMLLQQQHSLKSLSTSRYMTTTSSDEETTIVQICTTKIKRALETDDVKVTGAYDDPNGSHISIEVISSLFDGKRPVQRQQLVYKALWDELQGPVHAVDSMTCKTPEEK